MEVSSMMGLMILGALAVYLLVSVFVIKKAASWAKANNRKPWLWGGLAAFVMYNLVFWDLIPTLVMHKYYCSTQAGFWVYKTPEQWMKENPQIQLKSSEARVYKGTDNDYVVTNSLNHRLNLVRKLNPASFWLPIYKSEEYIEDTETKKMLMQRKDYFASNLGSEGFQYLKWISSVKCDADNKTLLAFGILEEKFKKLNDGEQK
jgi:hypothetical protein